MFEELLTNPQELFPDSDFTGIPTTKEVMATPDDYDAGFYSNNPKDFITARIRALIPYAQTHFKGQILCDLGCGRRNYAYVLACIAGAKAYVPIDKYHMPRWLEKFRTGKWQKSAEGVPLIPLSPIYADMVDFLGRLPDASVGILISGIDRTIIGENEELPKELRARYPGKKHLETLEHEIQRTTSFACITFASWLTLPALRKTEEINAFQLFTRY